MSRKNKAFRAWQHQNPGGSVAEAWDAAWANQQTAFYSRRMQAKDGRIAELEARLAECEPYLKDGETPAQCIDRNRRDVDQSMTVVVDALHGKETAEAQLTEREQERDYLRSHLLVVEAQLAAAERDAERLNWLDTNLQLKTGWRVGVAPAGNIVVTAVGLSDTSIRAAIDSAREQNANPK